MPDSYDGSWGDFSTQVAPDLGGVFNNQDYSNFFGSLGNTLGYTGSMFDEAPMNTGYNESMGGDQWGTGQQLSPQFLQQLQGLSFNPVQGADDPSVDVMQGNKNLGSYRYGSSGGTAQKLAGMAIPGLVTGGFGAGLGALFGGGALASGTGNALASGGMTAARGGDASQIGSSMLSSGLNNGIGTLNPAGSMGLEGGLAKTVNAGIGGALGSAVKGGNALTGGLSAMATTGLNSLGGSMANSFGDLWNSFGGGGDTEFDQLEGSGGNFDARQDPYGSNTYDEASPDFRFGGDFAQLGIPDGQQMRTGGGDVSSFSMPSFMPTGGQIGGFLGNNAGDLASLLYGMYNNKRQRNALQQGQNQQVDQANNNLKMFQDQAQKSIADITSKGNIENIYGQNSPYAQQLRAQLQAKAAASGRRLNTSGREVQLQAALADRAGQMQTAQNSQLANMYTNFANTQANLQNQQQGAMGQQYQNQLMQNNLKNNNMNMLLQGANKMGLFKSAGQGLQGLFGNSPVMQNAQPYQNFFGDYNSLTGGQ